MSYDEWCNVWKRYLLFYTHDAHIDVNIFFVKESVNWKSSFNVIKSFRNVNDKIIVFWYQTVTATVE